MHSLNKAESKQDVKLLYINYIYTEVNKYSINAGTSLGAVVDLTRIASGFLSIELSVLSFSDCPLDELVYS